MGKKSEDNNGSFFKEFIADAFDIDHGLMKTFLMLFRDPRGVMDAYRDDEIENYYSPFKYVVITTTLLTFVFFLAFDFSDILKQNMGAAVTSMQETGTQSEMAREIVLNATLVFQKLSRQFATVSMLFLLMPSLALFSFMFFRKKMGRYSEHFALSAYLVGQINCIQLLLCLPLFILQSLGWNVASYLIVFDLSGLAYMTYGILRVFEVRNFKGVLSSLFSPLFGYLTYMIVLLIITIVSAFVMYSI